MSTADARAVLASALANERSSFYRDLYARHRFDAAAVLAGTLPWSALPMTAKADFIAVPARERIFKPLDMVETVAFTSGTSGKGILIMPRRLPRPTHAGESLYPGSSLMSFYYYSYSVVSSAGDEPQRVVSGDPRRLPQSAALAQQAEVDALVGQPSVLIAFAQHLPADVRERIAQLSHTAERLSRLQFAALQALYPRAAHANVYASREIGPIAYSLGPDPFLMRPVDDLYLELLDDSGARDVRSLSEVAEGEVVVTTLYDTSFPHIRYRTGDRVRVHPHVAGEPLIEVLGRAEDERVRIPGGDLVLAELERAIAQTFPRGEVADFQCTIGESLSDGAPLVGLSITLFSNAPLDDASASARRLAQSLRVDRSRTWQDGVERGRYAPITLRWRPNTVEEGKRKRIVDAR